MWHEIANDTIGGDPIAITYCPLTGTAQAFDRGETTFGVSGRLINSNLLMYDRGTGSLWPQITAQAIEGPLEGEQLAEKQLMWTTWDKWRTAYPDTKILTEDTGYQRRYGNDPYGSYLPPRGYYTNDNLMFGPLAEGDEHPKAVVIGTRTADGAIAFNKERLLSEGILTGEIDGTTYTVVADGDSRLATSMKHRTGQRSQWIHMAKRIAWMVKMQHRMHCRSIERSGLMQCILHGTATTPIPSM